MDQNNQWKKCFQKIDAEAFFAHPEILNSGSWIAKPDEGMVYLFSDANDLDKDETIYNRKDKKMDLIYLKMARVWGSNSYCKRMQVGSLIVKNKSIISDGYNGSPTGFPNQCEDDDFVTLNYVLHAEANAITKLAKSTQSSENAILYVTVSPCFECSKLIIQSGIKRVVFKEVYRKPESIKFLFDAGIEILRIEKIGD
jgi:dCMP deaminase